MLPPDHVAVWKEHAPCVGQHGAKAGGSAVRQSDHPRYQATFRVSRVSSTDRTLPPPATTSRSFRQRLPPSFWPVPPQISRSACGRLPLTYSGSLGALCSRLFSTWLLLV